LSDKEDNELKYSWTWQEDCIWDLFKREKGSNHWRPQGWRIWGPGNRHGIKSWKSQN